MTDSSWLNGLRSPMNIWIRIRQPWHSENHGMHADGCDIEGFVIGSEVRFFNLEGGLSLD